MSNSPKIEIEIQTVIDFCKAVNAAFEAYERKENSNAKEEKDN